MYNNNMALLGFLLESARQLTVPDVQPLFLLMSISNEVTERYVETNPRDVQIQRRLMAMRQELQRLSCQQSRGSCMG